MVEKALVIIWYVLILIPAFFWFFLIREFNKKANVKFPSVVYAILYLIPILGHCWIAWSFLKDLREVEVKYKTSLTPLWKTYITKFVLPDIFLISGLSIFTMIGIFFFLIPVMGSSMGNFLVWIAPFIPFISFLWVMWGFWSTYKIVRKLNLIS